MTYSIDFRKKVLSIKQQDQLTFSKTSQRFGVGQSTVVQMVSKYRTQTNPK